MRVRTGPIIYTSVVLVLAFLVVGVPLFSGLSSSSRIRQDAVNQRTIVMCMINYSKDHAGAFPSGASGHPTTVFQELINQTDGLKEEYFYVPGNPGKRKGANNDGELLDEENCLIYVAGQNNSMPADSPLIADEMEKPGVYGRNHPWLKDGFAIVGYVGGHARQEKLNQKTPGATVKGPWGSGMKDIFQPRPAGKLAVPRHQILIP